MVEYALEALDLKTRRQSENRFFTVYLTLIALIILIGFSGTFYMRGLAPTAGLLPDLTDLRILHGGLATAWVVLLPLQGLLIRQGRVALHRRLGTLACWIGVVQIPVVLAATAETYRGFPADAPIGAAPLVALSFFSLAAFVLLGSFAWYSRFDAPAHKRYAVCAACVLMGPAVARLAFLPPPPLGVAFAEAFMLLMFAPLWLWDIETRGRPHYATVTGTAVFVAQAATRTLVMFTPWWASFVAGLPGFRL